MAIAFINAVSGFTDFSATTALTVPAGGYPIGTLVVVNIGSFNGDGTANPNGVTDSRGNSYTNVAAAAGNIGVSGAMGVYWSILGTALLAADTITPSLAAADGLQAVAEAFSGIVAVTPVDQSNSQRDGSSVTSHSSPSVSTTQADELLMGAHLYGDGAGTNTWTATGSFTVPTNGNINGVPAVRSILQYRIVSSTSSYASTGTSTGAIDARNSIVTFKASTGVDTGLAWIVA